MLPNRELVQWNSCGSIDCVALRSRRELSSIWCHLDLNWNICWWPSDVKVNARCTDSNGDTFVVELSWGERIGSRAVDKVNIEDVQLIDRNHRYHARANNGAHRSTCCTLCANVLLTMPWTWTLFGSGAIWTDVYFELNCSNWTISFFEDFLSHKLHRPHWRRLGKPKVVFMIHIVHNKEGDFLSLKQIKDKLHDWSGEWYWIVTPHRLCVNRNCKQHCSHYEKQIKTFRWTTATLWIFFFFNAASKW